jgi:hypothetical protein
MHATMEVHEALPAFSTIPHKKVEDEHSAQAGIRRLDTTIYSA